MKPSQTSFKRIIALLLVFFLFGLYGCQKEGLVKKYYVKYEIDSKTIYLGGKVDVTVWNEDSNPTTLRLSQRQKHEITIGPVGKNFQAKMQVQAVGATHDKLELYGKIHVSKNEEAFVLKSYDVDTQKRDYLELNHQVD